VPKIDNIVAFTGDAAWKRDDARWFRKHRDRSHRLRQRFPGEPCFRGDEPAMPPGHEVQVLIRQVEPGVRVRVGFIRNLEVEIPNSEPILHAIFHIVSTERDRTTPITVAEIAALALKYTNVGGAAS
jgi:hypothetical protein